MFAASSSLKAASKTTITNSPPTLCVVLSGGAGEEFVVLNNSKESPWKHFNNIIHHLCHKRSKCSTTVQSVWYLPQPPQCSVSARKFEKCK
jgi:hypothetical protein